MKLVLEDLLLARRPYVIRFALALGVDCGDSVIPRGRLVERLRRTARLAGVPADDVPHLLLCWRVQKEHDRLCKLDAAERKRAR